MSSEPHPMLSATFVSRAPHLCMAMHCHLGTRALLTWPPCYTEADPRHKTHHLDDSSAQSAHGFLSISYVRAIALSMLKKI